MTEINLKDFAGEVDKIKSMSGEDIAIWLHDFYEQASKDESWKTQEKCQVEFKSLPAENQRVMLKVGTCVLQRFILPLLLRIDELKPSAKTKKPKITSRKFTKRI